MKGGKIERTVREKKGREKREERTQEETRKQGKIVSAREVTGKKGKREEKEARIEKGEGEGGRKGGSKEGEDGREGGEYEKTNKVKIHTHYLPTEEFNSFLLSRDAGRACRSEPGNLKLNQNIGSRAERAGVLEQ